MTFSIPMGTLALIAFAVGGVLAIVWVFSRSGKKFETEQPITQPYRESSVADQTATDTTTTTIPPQPTVQTQRWWRRHSGWWAIAAFVVLIGVVWLLLPDFWPSGSEIKKKVIVTTPAPEGPNFWEWVGGWYEWLWATPPGQWVAVNDIHWFLLIAFTLGITLYALSLMKAGSWRMVVWIPVAFLLWIPTILVAFPILASHFGWQASSSGPVTSAKCPGLMGTGEPFTLNASRGWLPINDGSCRVIHDIVAGKVDFDTSDGLKTFGAEDGSINGYTYRIRANYETGRAKIILSLCPLSTIGHRLNLDCSRMRS